MESEQALSGAVPTSTDPRGGIWDTTAQERSQTWDEYDRATAPVTARLLELAGVRPGIRVLDVGTGLGSPALEAARVVGPQGYVIGIDISPASLALATQRAHAAGLANVTFQVGDANHLDHLAKLAARGGELPRQGAFEAILSRFMLMVASDVTATLGALRRLLVPHGRLAVAVWGRKHEVDFMTVPLDALTQAIQTLGGAIPERLADPFALGDPATLAGHVKAAGFHAIRVEPALVYFVLPSVDAYVAQQRARNQMVNAIIERHPPDWQTALWQVVSASIRPYVGRDGQVRVVNVAWIVSGEA